LQKKANTCEARPANPSTSGNHPHLQLSGVMRH